jgi:hypothetical protein
MERTGYRVSPPTVVKASPRDRGPARFRRSFARGPFRVSGVFRFSESDLLAFQTFWSETLRGGELSFDGLDRPHDGAVARARFTASNSYAVTRQGAESLVSIEDMVFWAAPADPGGLSAAWPAINPNMLLNGYAVTPGENAIAGDMDGFKSQRGVSRTVPDRITGVFYFTDAEYLLFEQWFVHGLAWGALWATGWTRPHDGAAGKARFDPADPWEAVRTAGGWRVSAAMQFIEA